MGRKRRNNVYRHFMLQEETHTSTCLLCYKTLNSTHGSNLMNHLKFMHKLEYQQILALNKGAIPPVATTSQGLPNSNDDDSNQSEPGIEVDVDKFYSMERGASRACCDICQASVDMKGGSLISHLKREHPKILKPATEESDAEDPEDNLYQEVVYLYDSDSKSLKNSRPIKMASSTPVSSQKQKVKQEMSYFNRQRIGSENRKRQRTQETVTSPTVDEFTEELENFGKYVTCLMKTIPKDLCTQLQMEVINLIMTAKIKMSKPESSTILVEKLDSVSSATYSQPIMVTVEAGHATNTLASADSNEGTPKSECI